MNKMEKRGLHITLWKLAMLVCVAILILLLIRLNCFAIDNVYAENAASWVLDGAFWVILCVGIVGAGMCCVKRNITGAVVAGLATGVVCYFCANPTAISTIGSNVAKIFGF